MNLELNRFTACGFTPYSFTAFGGLPPKAREFFWGYVRLSSLIQEHSALRNLSAWKS